MKYWKIKVNNGYSGYEREYIYISLNEEKPHPHIIRDCIYRDDEKVESLEDELRKNSFDLKGYLCYIFNTMQIEEVSRNQGEWLIENEGYQPIWEDENGNIKTINEEEEEEECYSNSLFTTVYMYVEEYRGWANGSTALTDIIDIILGKSPYIHKLLVYRNKDNAIKYLNSKKLSYDGETGDIVKIEYHNTNGCVSIYDEVGTHYYACFKCDNFIDDYCSYQD